MELEILKKKISTYRTEGGKITKVSDELAMEILYSWEQWTGPASGFYSAIGVDFRKVASIIGKAKKLKRDGHYAQEEFKEIKVLNSESTTSSLLPCTGIELIWDQGKIIRFPEVSQLIDFLKKVA
jgi:hypothetical protein